MAFVIAALLAIVTNAPRNYDEANVEGLRRLLHESWGDTEGAALRTVAINRLRVLGRAKTIHGQKGKALAAAIGFEAAAVAALMWSMIALLY